MQIEKKKLKSALSQLSIFASPDPVTGAAAKVLFQAKDGKVTLKATDGSNVGILAFDNADPAEMEFVTEFRNLNQATLFRDDFSLECNDGKLLMKQGEVSSMEYATSDPASFAFEEKEVESESVVTVPSEELKKLVGKVAYVRLEKDSRLFLTGVNFVYKDKTIFVQATDSHRILRNQMPVENGPDGEFQGVFSGKVIKVIEGIEDGKDVSIKMDDNSISILTEGLKAFMPKINCTYPGVDRFFSVPNKAQFTLEKGDVMESLAMFAGMENKSLVFKKDGDKLMFQQEDGNSQLWDRIPMSDFSGDEFKSCMDFDNFRELFANLKDGLTKLTFVWAAEKSGVYVKDEEKMEGVFMPLR